MSLNSKYRKFINEINDKGIKSAFNKTNKFLKQESKKIKPINLLKSKKVALSEENIIVSWSSSGETKDNFGDALNPILIKELSNKKSYDYKNIINVMNKPVYSVIGSILDNKNINNLEIWGSGFMFENGKFQTLPKKVYAVRGPLTRELILKQGVNCPEVYGDPGLLVSKIYNPNYKKKYKLGIVAHYVDKDNKYILNLKKKYKEEILLIDVEDSFENFIDKVKKCEFIASSSLHGVITADAYDIPSLWIKLSNKVKGGNFKYRDYMLSVNRKQMDPLIVNKEYRLVELIDKFNSYNIDIDLEKLLLACPFL